MSGDPDLQATLDNAEHASSLDDSVAAALAASFYLDVSTGKTIATYGQGWTTVQYLDAVGGYNGVALHHPASQTYIIVNRGTEGLKAIDDWQQNVGAALFNNPGPQMDSALQLLVDGFKAAPQNAVKQILICGHSLGGALADAQGAFAKAIFAQNALTCPPVRVVGIASAGFAHAAMALAFVRHLQPDADAPHFITHYVRAEDLVPHHPGRSVFGRDQTIASIFEARRQQANSGKSPGWEWHCICDLLREHDADLYWRFLSTPGANHVWYNSTKKTYEVRPGTRPSWLVRAGNPNAP
jgi:hypothetical protein